MKKLLLFLSLFVGVILFSGCAKDGENGKAFLSFTWDAYVDYYWDDNSNIPTPIYSYTEYEVGAGTYNYEYGCSDGAGNYWGFEGTYQITVNPGESGSLFTDGENGDDSYFTFGLYGGGPWFYKEDTTKILSPSLFKSIKNSNEYTKEYVGEKEVTVQNSGNRQMIINKQMYKLIKR